MFIGRCASAQRSLRQLVCAVAAREGRSAGGASPVLCGRSWRLDSDRVATLARQDGNCGALVGTLWLPTRHMREACGFPLRGQPCDPRGDPRGVPRPAGALLRRPRFKAQGPKRSPVCGRSRYKALPQRWLWPDHERHGSLVQRGSSPTCAGGRDWGSSPPNNGPPARGGAAAAHARRRLDPGGRRAHARGDGAPEETA